MALSIQFTDFRRLALDNNKRVYYYQRDNLLDLYFISEGMLIKSFIDLETVENHDVFFGDDLFIGATKLLFNIPSEGKSIHDTLVRKSIVDINQPVEMDGGSDIQQEGVDA